MNPDEWRFFLAASSGSVVDAPNPDPSWITSAVWGAITSLAKLPNFAGIEQSVSLEIGAWRRYFDSSETHAETLPGSWDSKLDPLQRLCVLRCVRPDKVVAGMQDYVKGSIGAQFIEPPPFDLMTSFKDSSNVLPIVFVLSPGADPYASLYKFAEDMKFNKRMFRRFKNVEKQIFSQSSIFQVNSLNSINAPTLNLILS